MASSLVLRNSHGKPFHAFPGIAEVTPAVDIARLMLRSTCENQ
jgi:hypothetical protein